MFSPSQIATPYLTNGDEAVKFSMTIENIKVFASTQKPACFRVRRSEFQCLGRHECRLQVRSPDASTLEAMVDYGVPLDPSTSIDCVLTIIRLKSQTGMPDIVLKMLHGTRKIGVLQDILDPVNGYTKDNALHLDVEMSIFEPKPINRISLKIPRVKDWLSSQGTQRIVSQPIHIGDAKWHMSVKPGRDENNASNIGVYIHCNPMADTCAEWMCVVSRTLVLKSHIRKKPNLAVTSENYLYTDDDNSWAAIDFVTEKDLLDPAKGYLTAGGSAEFYAYLTVAQPLTRKIDEYAGKIFSQFEPELEMNGSLSFSKRKLRVNKELLAAYSPFFEALFFTRRDDFKERDMQQIPLDEIRLEDFKVLLSVIYPKYGVITDDPEFWVLNFETS
ncbi:BTB/POZ domain-containing protein [Ditylenchus destructor]|uniref:BTB/POZ domain-containing protein n=1 Tax=Ditylenchus destructor TaxID=166010 RepID=A0AAD4NCL3_9BILA|nr:BTB/POZ domain-containing protein [Ditylenchus destructor]